MLHFYHQFIFLILVVTQDYETGTSAAYVIIGNSALLKCEVPSFVGDFVTVVNWIDSEGNEHFPSENRGTIFALKLKWDTQIFSSQNSKLFSTFCSCQSKLRGRIRQ